MPFTGKVGDTFWRTDSSGFEHRWVILTNENTNGEIAVINFTDAKSSPLRPRLFTQKRYKDQFSKDTTIRIDFADLIKMSQIQLALANGFYREGNFCRLDIVNEIVDAIFESENVKIKVGRELKSQYEERYKNYYKGNDY